MDFTGLMGLLNLCEHCELFERKLTTEIGSGVHRRYIGENHYTVFTIHSGPIGEWYL